MQLAELRREVLKLTKEGKSGPEIARATGTSRSNVYRIQRLSGVSRYESSNRRKIRKPFAPGMLSAGFYEFVAKRSNRQPSTVKAFFEGRAALYPWSIRTIARAARDVSKALGITNMEFDV